jgi:hypothetical protein
MDLSFMTTTGLGFMGVTSSLFMANLVRILSFK